MTTQTWETAQQKSQELVSRSKELVALALDTGRTYVEAVREAIEEEVRDLFGKAREVESKGQEFLQQRLGKQLEQLQKLEEVVRERANQVIAEVRPQIESRLPALAPVLGKLEEGLKRVDAAIHKVEASVAGATAKLAIPDYDALNVKQITEALASLSKEELEAIRDYEAAHKNRKTVLREIEARLAELA